MKKESSIDTEKFQDGELVESWNKKRVIVACIILILFFAGGVYAFSKTKEKAVRVLGIQTGSLNASAQNVKLPTQEDANKLLEQAKSELNNLTGDNLTSSTAAIQKVIQDFQAIQKGKGSPMELICKTVCGK